MNIDRNDKYPRVPLFRKRGLTLAEMLAVLVIITVLITLALPQYYVVVERSKAKEANAILRLIRAAQEVYFSEYRVFFYNAADSHAFDLLDIEDPNARPLEQRDWDYTISSPDAYTDFSADATRTRGKYQGRYYRIQSTGDVQGPF